jgi:ubiquinone/menaquinone biosynthesis C-methylase UbiE
MRGYGDRVRIRIGDPTKLEFPDASFDCVISYGSIKHWTSQDAGLTECLRVLKPGGPNLARIEGFPLLMISGRKPE